MTQSTLFVLFNYVIFAISNDLYCMDNFNNLIKNIKFLIKVPTIKKQYYVSVS